MIALPSLSYAQSNASVNTTEASEGLSLNLGKSTSFIGLSPTLRRAVTDLPDEDTSLFSFEGSDAGCFDSDAFCLTERKDKNRLDFGYSKQKFLSLNKSGLDLELTPSASVHFDDERRSAIVGALLRIGDDLRKDANFDKNTWYFFAGADAEALTYRPNSTSQLTRGNFNLQDRIIVGDAQAGLGYRIGDADLSLAYIRREVSGFNNNDISDDVSFTEDAAALSFTWRR